MPYKSVNEAIAAGGVGAEVLRVARDAYNKAVDDLKATDDATRAEYNNAKQMNLTFLTFEQWTPENAPHYEYANSALQAAKQRYTNAKMIAGVAEEPAQASA